MTVVLNTIEIGNNVIELSDSGIVDDLPRYTVHSIINRKVRIELFETLADAEVYMEEKKRIMYAIERKTFRSFSADFDPATLDK